MDICNVRADVGQNHVGENHQREGDVEIDVVSNQRVLCLLISEGGDTQRDDADGKGQEEI